MTRLLPAPQSLMSGMEKFTAKALTELRYPEFEKSDGDTAGGQWEGLSFPKALMAVSS